MQGEIAGYSNKVRFYRAAINFTVKHEAPTSYYKQEVARYKIFEAYRKYDPTSLRMQLGLHENSQRLVLGIH